MQIAQGRNVLTQAVSFQKVIQSEIGEDWTDVKKQSVGCGTEP